MSVIEEVQTANDGYARGFEKGDLSMPPGRRFAIVTCMDARIDPARVFGLEEGDAHVIRNAGGLATDDAIRSLVISHWLLGTQEFLIAGHTDCGMVTFTNEGLRTRLAEETGADASEVDFHPFPEVEERVRDSVRAVRESPLIPDGVRVSGWVYDVRTGRLNPVDV
jgi:carbonic anhydrase